ncbi:MAG: gfo/Idh/MocA family oxidoreductase [Eubacterium sp.]|nr:gfo/Idh/MocA family oxidoreductase [Eubacterium sp.]
MGKVLKYGMVGGGIGAFIGEAHRKAINLDGKASIAAGCFSRSYENTLATGESLGIEKDRLYENYEEMAIKEANREDGIEFVVIVTTNYAHYDACKAFLNAGIPVVCEKPLTVTLKQALELEKLANEKNLQFMVTYVYSGHVTAMNIKEIIAAGEIGEIRTVMGEYPQGWLAFEDVQGNKQGEWRTDPAQSGKTNALGDIGTHIENTVFRMTGLKIKRLLARMDKVVPGRTLDDNSTVMLEYENGSTGVYWASQIAIGHDNGLRIRIYGSKGSISWFQEQPEIFHMAKQDGSLMEIHRGHSTIRQIAAKYTRLPSGHTEGWFEAMGNFYSNYIECLLAQRNDTFTGKMIEYPTLVDGVDGVRFIEACLKSSENGSIWVDF